jgi:hypothetical protein
MMEKDFDLEGFNQSMSKWADDQKTAPPYFVESTRTTMKNLEDFLEKQGISVARHSERLVPENVWPDGYEAAVRKHVEKNNSGTKGKK